MRLRDITGLVGETPIVGLPRLSPNPSVRIWAKLEGQNPTGSVKDRIAVTMIEDAERTGKLNEDTILLEPTSGNTGISLAFIARRKGYRLVCVMPETASVERAQMIRLFGGEVVYSPGDEGSNGSIRMARQMAEDPKYLMLYQYGNDANPRAHYQGTAPEILRDVPEITHFVSGLGTGGTLTGVGRFFKENRPDVQIVAVEPEQGDLVYGLRSLADGFIPEVFDETILDSKIKVSTVASVQLTQELAAKEGIFAGVSSGATVHVAQRLASKIDQGDIVCLFADGGWKYLSTEIWTENIERAAKKVEYMPW
ncbi:MAG TPA: cysteine synthase [Actinomycetota bacterium]|nr:cysteine synthase [Actinomycetota bacterium]